MGRTIAMATLVAGMLDILIAICLSLYFGRDPMDMLRYVASGPLPPATQWGGAGSVLGLVTSRAHAGDAVETEAVHLR